MTMPQETPKRRWIMPLLFVSLAANLLVAGMVAGAYLSPDSPRRAAGLTSWSSSR